MLYHLMSLIIQLSWMKDSVEQNKLVNKVQDCKDGSGFSSSQEINIAIRVEF